MAAGKDRSAWLIDMVQERPVLCFLHTQRVCAAALSHHHPSLAATASDDATVGIWDVPDASQFASRRQKGIVEAHRRYQLRHEGVQALAFSPDGAYVATGSSDGTVGIWETVTDRQLARLDH